MRGSARVAIVFSIAAVLSAVAVGGGVMSMAYVAGSIFWFLVGGFVVAVTLGWLAHCAIETDNENKKAEE